MAHLSYTLLHEAAWASAAVLCRSSLGTFRFHYHNSKYANVFILITTIITLPQENKEWSLKWYICDMLLILNISKINSLQWCHIGRDTASNHRRLDCLLSRLFRRWSKEISNLRVTGLSEGNPPVIGAFPSQRASDANNVPIRWRHHVRWAFSWWLTTK